MTTAKVITPMQTAIARDSARAGISAFNWRAYAARILEKSASFKSEGRVEPDNDRGRIKGSYCPAASAGSVN
jgi:hypothetical protein